MSRGRQRSPASRVKKDRARNAQKSSTLEQTEPKECGEIMKKVHDMGGRREEFGPIDRSDHQVEDWERVADAVNIVLNAKGHKTTDEMRRAIESLDGYREMGYYERWAAAAELLVVEKGLLTKEEIDARAAELEQRWRGE
jgi:Nitrile hydratase beta subunit, N-terminal